MGNMNDELISVPHPSAFQKVRYGEANKIIQKVIESFQSGQPAYYVSVGYHDVAMLVHKAFNSAGYDVTPIKHYSGDYRESPDWSFTISVPAISPERDNL